MQPSSDQYARWAKRANVAAKTLANIEIEMRDRGVRDTKLLMSASDATLRASHVAAQLAYASTLTRSAVPA